MPTLKENGAKRAAQPGELAERRVRGPPGPRRAPVGILSASCGRAGRRAAPAHGPRRAGTVPSSAGRRACTKRNLASTFLGDQRGGAPSRLAARRGPARSVQWRTRAGRALSSGAKPCRS